MAPQTIPDVLVLVAPFIVSLVSGIIGQAKFPAWGNAVITGLVIVGVSVLAVFVGGAKFTSNILEDFVLVAGYISALAYGPFKPLQNYLILGPNSQLPAVRAPADSPNGVNRPTPL